MAATQQFSTNTGLGITPLFDPKNGKIGDIWNDLTQIRTALRVLQGALDNYTGALPPDSDFWPQIQSNQSVLGGNGFQFYCGTNEDILTGQPINLLNDGGFLTARLASAADASKPCRGFAAGDSLSGQYGRFYLFGINRVGSSLTPALPIYLSVTPGQFSGIEPSASGQIVQKLGWVMEPHNVWFNPSQDWKVVP